MTCKYGNLTQVKWLSLLYHVLGEHEWLTGKCEHEALQGPPTDADGNQIF